MQKVKANSNTDNYQNSRFNAVKHGGYSTAFLSLSKEEREQIFDRLSIKSTHCCLNVWLNSLHEVFLLQILIGLSDCLCGVAES
ncbi:hypothetical protein FXB78_01195 [Aggregatibacter actinomycetemcomitans]|uniref:hypothetical protein n=1 Tax=Aggregatibacter actinomycetemcomitans TaxID=714 RepID=UPI0011DC1D4B|nr:hypothetical protein [Aggregatibacter actinomycetemcomitans]TYA51909.1 hypothetical protein FXB81_01205 [Aggregatibacter actinomycetemcomitans]TYB30007.1 hypothetical protein FXB78_01195 [Aggregatibacter actinomycetemcomitans]